MLDHSRHNGSLEEGRARKRCAFTFAAAAGLTLQFFEEMLWVDSSTLGVDIWGDKGPEVATAGPQKATSRDTEKDSEGGHGSTSQLNLTISLPRQSSVRQFCQPFGEA